MKRKYSNPKIFFVKKLAQLSYKIYPFFTILTFAFLFIEAVTYTDFISKYFLFNAKTLLFLNIFLGIIVVLSRNSIKPNGSTFTSLISLVFHLNYLAGPVLVLVYYLMVVAEATKYPNYIFSTFHINPDNFMYLVFFSIFNVLIGLLSEGIFIRFFLSGDSKLISSQSRKNTFLIFIILLLFFVTDNLLKTIRESIKSNVYILKHLDSDYDDKMTQSWHFFYQYMKFVKEVTPENSAIAIPPPQRPFLSEGNSVLVRYFLYPRYLVTPENEIDNQISPDYFLLTKGLWKAYSEDDYGWPRIEINAEKIFYFNNETGEYSVVEKDFDPNDPANKYSWGLIKAEK